MTSADVDKKSKDKNVYGMPTPEERVLTLCAIYDSSKRELNLTKESLARHP